MVNTMLSKPECAPQWIVFIKKAQNEHTHKQTTAQAHQKPMHKYMETSLHL